MYSARGDESIQHLVMAYLGVQSKGDEMKGRACAAFQNILQSFRQPDGPARHDLVQFVDGQGYLNLIAVGYWVDPTGYDKWKAARLSQTGGLPKIVCGKASAISAKYSARVWNSSRPSSHMSTARSKASAFCWAR
jgi:hypothetical protein